MLALWDRLGLQQLPTAMFNRVSIQFFDLNRASELLSTRCSATLHGEVFTSTMFKACVMHIEMHSSLGVDNRSCQQHADLLAISAPSLPADSSRVSCCRKSISEYQVPRRLSLVEGGCNIFAARHYTGFEAGLLHCTNPATQQESVQSSCLCRLYTSR